MAYFHPFPLTGCVNRTAFEELKFALIRPLKQTYWSPDSIAVITLVGMVTADLSMI
jgi:hypothetical protein